MQSCLRINIKNIKIGPHRIHPTTQKLVRRIYIECEDNLTEDNKKQLMQNFEIEMSDTLEISLTAEKKRIEDEGT